MNAALKMSTLSSVQQCRLYSLPSCTEPQNTDKATFTQEPCMMMEPSPSLVQRKTCLLLPHSNSQTTESMVTKNTDMEGMICLLSIDLLLKKLGKRKKKQTQKNSKTHPTKEFCNL